MTGTFQGDIAIFDTRSELETNMILFRNELLSRKEAVSHMKLSPNGYHLYCGYRSAEKSLVMYDLRFVSGDVQKVAPVFQLDRPSYSQQRLYFDLSTSQEESEETVISGDSQGNVLFTDQSGSICRKANLHSGPITNALLHPFCPILLTTCGERPLRENFGVQSSLNLWHV